MPNSNNGKRRRVGKAKSDHDQIRNVPLDEIIPSPENDLLYKPVREDDPEVQKLAESIQQNGLKEPLVLTLDYYVLSGHRRRVAAMIAGLTEVPCRFEPIKRSECDNAEYVTHLREHNRQREKSLVERLREQLVDITEDDAYAELEADHYERTAIKADTIDVGQQTHRAVISKAKLPFLAAAKQIIYGEMRPHWPLTVRQIHYRLLNDPPLVHASKPASRYGNKLKSYRALTDLLARARLAGHLPMDCIADETRPVVQWAIHSNSAAFVREQLDEDLLRGYARDLMQSQSIHIELIGEKMTVASILRPIAREFRIPLVTGRGYCSVAPRHELAERFKESGKEKLLLLICSDFDPDGEEIAASFARSLIHDFGIDNCEAIKVALTKQQVDEHQLVPQMSANQKKSPQRRKFIEKYGENVYELEALSPAALQQIVREAILSVIDVALFNQEAAAERRDAKFIHGCRSAVMEHVQDVLDGLDDDSPDDNDDEEDNDEEE